ncbi:hypothetical protein SAMN05443634_11035 [Chishuiella changwenlii]|nr:hypothetical protein SAMN05443634_11035 [Chishuiella changwenlii]
MITAIEVTNPLIIGKIYIILFTDRNKLKIISKGAKEIQKVQVAAKKFAKYGTLITSFILGNSNSKKLSTKGNKALKKTIAIPNIDLIKSNLLSI